MAEFLRRLNGPLMVVDFQRFCGVFPKSLPAGSNECDEKGSVQQAAIQALGGKNGVTKLASGQGRKRVLKSSSVDGNEDDAGMNKRGNVVDGSKSTSGPSSPSGSASGSEDENERDYKIKNNVLYILFHFGASLGNEVFYILFFPWWFWNIDGYVGRRLCLFWSLFMYLGQATKDIVKWPRPASPPVVRMEKRYALEYGMPSTHSMVGAGVPFGILILTYGRYNYPFGLGLFGAIVWCSLVCLSRLYLGMHSILDILAGLLYVFSLMPVVLPFLDAVDHFILTHPWSPVFCIIVPLVMCLAYPTLDRWSTARGDTTLILAVSSGVSLGHWISFQYGFMHKASDPAPYDIIPPTWNWFGEMLMRLSIGIIILFSTRAICKMVSLNVTCFLAGIDKYDKAAQQILTVELPCKFITYLAIAFNTVYLAPQVFSYLGIERETFFTEI